MSFVNLLKPNPEQIQHCQCHWWEDLSGSDQTGKTDTNPIVIITITINAIIINNYIIKISGSDSEVLSMGLTRVARVSLAGSSLTNDQIISLLVRMNYQNHI